MHAHSADLKAYASLKQDLANRFPNDIFSYTLGKEEFVATIDKKAGWHVFRVIRALTSREWEAAKPFRQKYFFDKVPIQNPYTWAFNHPDHAHLVIYQGIDIIGYAHIQLWPKQRAAIRIIVIDETKRGHGLGQQFLTFIERWLKTQNYKSTHMESSPDALQFYKKHGDIDMPFNDSDGYESDPQDIALGKML